MRPLTVRSAFGCNVEAMPGKVAKAIDPSINLRFIVLPCADEVCSSVLPDEVEQIFRMA